MSPPLRAIIFDCDGVIADTEPFHFMMFRKILAEEGIHLTEKDYYKKYLGMDDKECFETILAIHGKKPNRKKIASLTRCKSRRYMKALATHLTFIPGAIPFIKKASKKFSLAIASGALRREILSILKRGGIVKAFPTIVSAGDIRKGKPDPEGFLTALKRLNQRRKFRSPQKAPVHPQECLVIEDSPFGLQAARRAGMKCLAITTSYDETDLAKADMARKNFLGLTVSSLVRAFSVLQPGTGP